MARIFLSYAREDETPVRDVYRRLREAGFDVWMDKIDLLPGQLWQQEIPQAIRHSDFILIFFSRHSVARHGYIQREFRLALETLDEMPPGVIHTIPIRLDDCQIPEQFRHLQWSDLAVEGEFDRIVRALRLGLEQRQTGAPEPAREPPPAPRLDSDRPLSEAERRSVADASVHPPQEAASPTGSPPKKPRRPDQRSRWGSVMTMVGLVIAAVSALAAVLVIPEVRQWLRLDTPPGQQKPSKPVSPPPVVSPRIPPEHPGGNVPSVPLPQEITTRLGMQLVLILAGEFQIGSNDEPPVHRVRISEPFYLGKYEVTQAEWEAVMGTNPSFFTENPKRPVERVSWDDVQEFMRRLNRQEGWEACRLPTEAQWEYAARAGTTTERYEDDVDAIAWYAKNSGGRTHAVGQQQPNAWGLYDMLGNVAEWCHDGKRAYTADTAVDPMGPINAGARRVVRGGSWYDSTQQVRAAYRSSDYPALRARSLGFRCASSGSQR